MNGCLEEGQKEQKTERGCEETLGRNENILHLDCGYDFVEHTSDQNIPNYLLYYSTTMIVKIHGHILKRHLY